MRILVDIADNEIAALDKVARDTGKSRAFVIRAAIGEWLAKHRREACDDAFGLWGGADDGVAYQERMRREW